MGRLAHARWFAGQLAVIPPMIALRVVSLVVVEIQEGIDTLDARLEAIEARL